MSLTWSVDEAWLRSCNSNSEACPCSPPEDKRQFKSSADMLQDGTLRHNPSGMRVCLALLRLRTLQSQLALWQVSPDKGVVVDGQEYKLSPQDIDLDCCLRFGKICFSLHPPNPLKTKPAAFVQMGLGGFKGMKMVQTDCSRRKQHLFKWGV